MPLPTVATRPDRLDQAADTIAMLVEHVDLLVVTGPDYRADVVADLVAACTTLTAQLAGTYGQNTYDELAGRLWMVGMAPTDVHELAGVTVRSLEDRLLDTDDTARIAYACVRSLGGGR